MVATQDSPLDALVVGAGFSGLYQLYELRRRGYRVHLVEANAGPGGVWFANRYPGARVDSHVPNYEYSLEAIWRDWTWSERFPGHDELRRYFDHVVSALELGPDISFDTRVLGAAFDESSRTWSVRVAGLDGAESVLHTQFFIPCLGFGSRPYVPELPGLDRFEGPCHHTAQWPTEGLAWEGKRVGTIGVGASGVQIVQEAAKVASQLTVFQRTPVTALPMQQRTLDPAEVAITKQSYPEIFAARNSPPGSMYDMIRRGDSALQATPAERNAVFTEAWNAGGFEFWFATFADVGMNMEANRLAYDYWRENTHARVDDPAVAEVLAPMEQPYAFGAKRPSLEQDFYEAFNQPNVELVDLLTTPIAEITETGVRCGDDHYELDILILATGFDANTGGLTQIDARGSDGASLAERWSDGVDTTMGIALNGFPNMLFLYGPQSPAAFCNGPTCAELQSIWVGDLLDHMGAEGLTRIESTLDSDLAWSADLDKIAQNSLIGATDSWYMGANIPGKRRQLLNHPNSDAYLRSLAASAADSYERFVLS